MLAQIREPSSWSHKHFYEANEFGNHFKIEFLEIKNLK